MILATKHSKRDKNKLALTNAANLGGMISGADVPRAHSWDHFSVKHCF